MKIKRKTPTNDNFSKLNKDFHLFYSNFFSELRKKNFIFKKEEKRTK